MNFSLEEQVRYSRQIILDELNLEGQIKLKLARVAVIGAGGLSCPVLTYLVSAGVGYVRVIDDDVVALSNLQRQVLYTCSDVGDFKVRAAGNRLKDLNPNVEVDTRIARLESVNAEELLSGVDLVIDGSDNFSTRYLVNDTCLKLDLPLVAASIFKFEIQLAVFNYKGGPDYRALYPEAPAPEERPACGEIGVLGVVPAIAGSLQANEALKIILGQDGILTGQLLVFNCLNMSIRKLNFGKSLQVSKRVSVADQVSCSNHIDSVPSICFKDYLATKLPLLDVRTRAENSMFNIGGLCIPLQELSQRHAELDSFEDLVVYCKSGVRSARAIQYLNQVKPHLKLMNLKGGIEAVPADNWVS